MIRVHVSLYQAALANTASTGKQERVLDNHESPDCFGLEAGSSKGDSVAATTEDAFHRHCGSCRLCEHGNHTKGEKCAYQQLKIYHEPSALSAETVIYDLPTIGPGLGRCRSPRAAAKRTLEALDRRPKHCVEPSRSARMRHLLPLLKRRARERMAERRVATVKSRTGHESAIRRRTCCPRCRGEARDRRLLCSGSRGM